jgi:hypothetical protein
MKARFGCRPATPSSATSFAKTSAALITVVASALLMALPVLAYQYPLSTTDIQDAYFIGARMMN